MPDPPRLRSLWAAWTDTNRVIIGADRAPRNHFESVCLRAHGLSVHFVAVAAASSRWFARNSSSRSVPWFGAVVS
jgi:hypothetical protein